MWDGYDEYECFVMVEGGDTDIQGDRKYSFKHTEAKTE